MSAQVSTHATESIDSKLHTLSDKWVLYAHLPHDTNWDINS